MRKLAWPPMLSYASRPTAAAASSCGWMRRSIRIAAAGVRLDRFVRQALKAHLNEEVEIEKAEFGPVKRIEFDPAVDVSLAHDLMPHIKKVMCRTERLPAMAPWSMCPSPIRMPARPTKIGKVSDGPGYVDEIDRESSCNYHDSHLPDGAFDITFEDVGGLASRSS